jgi:hypothetical protein
MQEETEIAFDLFSTSYVRVPKVTEQEKREAAEKRLRAAIAMGDVSDIYMMFGMSDLIEDMQKKLFAHFLYGSSELETKKFRGLAVDWSGGIDEYYSPFTYVEPNLGQSPAAKPDQPRHWVMMNQAPKRPRK